MKAPFMNESGGFGERRSMIHENRAGSKRLIGIKQTGENTQKSEIKKAPTS